LKKNDSIDLAVGKLNSVKTQIPFEYYYLPFCRPDELRRREDNLGEILTGDYTQNSLYQINMMSNSYCKQLCSPRNYTGYEVELFQWMIERDYKASWYIDDLPAAYKLYDHQAEKEEIKYEDGFPLGIKLESGFVIYNHLRLHLYVHEMHDRTNSSFTIVGFAVEPQR
jgi:transmembrane 9 superfamily protein 2/4